MCPPRGHHVSGETQNNKNKFEIRNKNKTLPCLESEVESGTKNTKDPQAFEELSLNCG